jgi:hypothetical protein
MLREMWFKEVCVEEKTKRSEKLDAIGDSFEELSWM